MARFVLALLAVYLLSAEASLETYTSLLNQPPGCNSCETNFKLAFEGKDDDWEELESSLASLCDSFPQSLKSRIAGFSSKCSDMSNLVDGDKSGWTVVEPIAWCATMQVCPNVCQYCESRSFIDGIGYYAWDDETPDNKGEFCNAATNNYGFVYQGCEMIINAFSSPGSSNVEAYDFCSHSAGTVPFCASKTNSTDKPRSAPGFTGYAAQDCLDEPPISCSHGVVSRSYHEKESHGGFIFVDPCSWENVCVCDIGWALGESGVCDVQAPIPGAGNPRAQQQQEAFITRLGRTNHGMMTERVRLQTGDQLQATIQHGERLMREQRLRGREGFSCDGSTWTYFTDSIVDGVTYTDVGRDSEHEYYGFAVRQDLETVTMAVNLNLYEWGQMMWGGVTVSMGDWIINPANPDGTYTPLNIADSSGKLWGLHVDWTNDNPDDLGLYKNARFHSVANTNNGFNEVSAYIAMIDGFNSVANNQAAALKFGGGIDEEGERGIHYLTETPYNEMIPGASTFVGGLSSDVEYYIVEDPAFYEEDAEALRVLTEDYGLTWTAYNGIGTNHRVWHIPRILFPPEEQWYRFHVAAECFNEVIAGEVMLCELPSKSPSPTRTPTRTPSRTPSNSITRTATSSSSVTRTPSPSATTSPAPSFPAANGDCICVDYLQSQDDFKYNTIIFGDFVGTSDTQGALVVCGDADLRGYSVGDALPPDVNRNDLIVKGDLTFLTGRVHAGNIVYGNDATIGNSVAHGMMNRTITQNADAYDCASAESYYKVMSLGLGAQTATGATHIEDDGTVVFTRQGAGTAEFFDLDCSSLPLINKMTFHGIPSAQTVVVNWRGTECDVSNLNIVPQNPSMVVFNFPQATSINIKTAAIEATVIAPTADITGNGGVIKGQVVAASWSGSTQQNYMECLACLETFVVPVVGF